MSAKTKITQPQTPNEFQSRDSFQTPNYAVDLLVPFIPKYIRMIWECAAGDGRIVERLRNNGYYVWATDININSRANEFKNFLTDIPSEQSQCIITNPPFSLKKKFYERCKEFGIPFALLIPADYCGWLIDAVDKDGAEKIIPTRRIDYITPYILSRVHEGEIWESVRHQFEYDSLKKFKDAEPDVWEEIINKPEFKNVHIYGNIWDVPYYLLQKYHIGCDFHSMWLTWGFNLGKTETFVELTNEQKRDNI